MGFFDRLLSNVTKGTDEAKPIQPRAPKKEKPVSYTHLTLPTICSV